MNHFTLPEVLMLRGQFVKIAKECYHNSRIRIIITQAERLKKCFIFLSYNRLIVFLTITDPTRIILEEEIVPRVIIITLSLMSR